MAAGETLLELNGVTKRYGAVVAVDGISASLHPGEYLCLLGPSGCGKTTLLRLIAGFEVPDGGVVRLHGRDMTSVPPERRDVNVVFQNYALFPHLTVAENVGFGLRMKGVPRAEARERVTDALRQVRLEREANRLPRQISGGQQQRVALARALVNRPALLLLDEPLSALDPELRQQVQDELRRVQRETGIAFLHITHDQDEALSLADRVAVMRSGRFEQIGTPREVYAAPASRFVASFVGGANLLEGRVAGEGWVELGSETSVHVPGLGATADPAEPITLAVRPEAVRLANGDSGEGLPGRIIRAAFRGSEVEYSIEATSGWNVSGGLLRALVPAGVGAAAEGDTVRLEIAPTDWVVIRGGTTNGAG